MNELNLFLYVCSKSCSTKHFASDSTVSGTELQSLVETLIESTERREVLMALEV